MKFLALVFTTLISFTSLAVEKYEDIYYWKNSNKKIFNYYVQPKLDISIEKLDAGVDEYYAIVSVKTKSNPISSELIDELAGSFEPKRVAVNTKDVTMQLSFRALRYSFDINVMNMPNGPGIEETFFIDKSTYFQIKETPGFVASFDIEATPLISKMVESKRLPRNTCRNLFISGNKLEKVSNEYLKLLNRVNTMNIVNEQTRIQLIKDIQDKCFNELSIRAYSFKELMNSEIKQNLRNPLIEVFTYKDLYSKESLKLNFEGEL